MSSLGGWRLTLTCVGCGEEDMFRGYLLSLAEDAARREGWHFDPGATEDRPAMCPDCSGSPRH